MKDDLFIVRTPPILSINYTLGFLPNKTMSAYLPLSRLPSSLSRYKVSFKEAVSGYQAAPSLAHTGQ
jgi:hypothetical protein